MRTLDRYVAGIFIKNLVIAVLALTALFLFQVLLVDLYNHDYTVRQVIFYHLLNIPKIVVEMSPPAVLLATVLTLSGLARSHELVAAFSIGVGLSRFMAVILSAVILVSCLMIVMQGFNSSSDLQEKNNFLLARDEETP